MLKKIAVMAALALALSPAAAHADWLFTPNIGGGFGGDASGREHLTYGASIGWMGAGIIGWEADLATRRSSSKATMTTRTFSTPVTATSPR